MEAQLQVFLHQLLARHQFPLWCSLNTSITGCAHMAEMVHVCYVGYRVLKYQHVHMYSENALLDGPNLLYGR